MRRRLERSSTDKVIAGICGGLAEHLQVDATLTRAVFVIAGIFSGGLFILGYIALLFFMPLPGQRAPVEDIFPSSSTPPPSGSAEATEMTGDAAAAPRPPTTFDPDAEARRQRWIGYVLLTLGGIFLLSNAGAFRFVRWDVIWPIAIIGLGLYFVLRRTGR